MVRPALRSRSYRRVKVRVTKRTVSRFDKRKPSIAKCAICKAELKGIPRERPYKMQNMALTKKRPERPFGGYLCTKCSKQNLKNLARQK